MTPAFTHKPFSSETHTWQTHTWQKKGMHKASTNHSHLNTNLAEAGRARLALEEGTAAECSRPPLLLLSTVSVWGGGA